MYNYQTLTNLLELLTAELGNHSDEVVLLRSRLTCKNCKESRYQGKTNEQPEAWICKHHGTIPKDFKGACDFWVNNIRDNK